MSRDVGVCAAVFPVLGAVNFELIRSMGELSEKGFLAKKMVL